MEDPFIIIQYAVAYSLALIVVTIAIALTIGIGYVTYKFIYLIKEKGVQTITDWLFEKSDY